MKEDAPRMRLGAAIAKHAPRGVLGSMALAGFFHLFSYAERDHLGKFGSDKIFLAQAVVAPLFGVGVVYLGLSTAPYTLLPALVGMTGRGVESTIRTTLLDQTAAAPKQAPPSEFQRST